MLGLARSPSRLNCLTLKNTSKSIRNYSIALQHPRLHTHRPRLPTTGHARNFWGAAASSQAPTPAPMAPPLESTPTEVITAAASEPIWTDAAEPSSSLIDTISTSPPLGSSPIADAVVAPLQYGDLSALGLLSYTPAGLVRYSLEIINVATGLPWFWTIVAGTAFWRLLLFPATIRSTRNSSLMAAHGPELKAASEEFKAAVAFSPIPEERAAAMNKLMQTYTKAGVNPRTMMLTPFLQLPVVFGVFLGVKGMCELPLEQMKFSGVEWMPDLTVLTSVADPWFMLPALAVVGMNLQMKLAVREVDPNKPEARHMFNALRVLGPFGAIFMSWLPAGVMVSMLTTVGTTLLTSAVLQLPRIRASFGIPALPKEPPRLPSIMESREALRKYLREGREKALQQVMERERQAREKGGKKM